MERNASCFFVGGSAPVAHWEGLSSWEDILGGGVCLEVCEIAMNNLEGIVRWKIVCLAQAKRQITRLYCRRQ